MAPTNWAPIGKTHIRKLMMVRRAKTRANRKGLPFNITVDDFEIPKRCPALGIWLNGSAFESTSCLDRIIPDLGYTKGNVIVISELANRIKTNATVPQIRAVADFYQRLIMERLSA